MSIDLEAAREILATPHSTCYDVSSDVEEESLRDTAEEGEKPGAAHAALEIVSLKKVSHIINHQNQDKSKVSCSWL